MLKLRPYQEECIVDIHSSFSKNIKKLIVQAPTGSGKTVIFSELARRVSQKNKKILVLTDRVELLTQAGGSFKKVGLNSFYIEAGCNVVSNSFNCYIAMSQTLRRRLDKEYWQEFIKSIDLIIIDECHKQEFNFILQSKLTKSKYIIGFTATPKRSGKMRQLGLDYQKIIQTVSVQQLIDLGYLVGDDYYGLDSPNMKDVAIDRMKGDYQEKSMFQMFNSPQLYSGLVKNYNNIAPNTKTLVFCVNIEHTITTTLELIKSGLDVRFLVSVVAKPKQPKEDKPADIVRYNERMKLYNLYTDAFAKYSGKRSDVLEWFSNSKCGILVNAGILTTGYDCPSIETIILNRATISITLLLQMLGRGSRINKRKTSFNILDFGGNCSRLGYYAENRSWSLWHDEYGGKGIPPVKNCGFNSEGKPITDEKGCRRLIMASYKICPFCGFKYPDKKIKSIDLTGTAFDTVKNKAVKTEQIKDMTNAKLYEYWKIKKHKSAWLWRQLWYRGREKAIKQFGFEYGWSSATIRKAIEFCSML